MKQVSAILLLLVCFLVLALLGTGGVFFSQNVTPQQQQGETLGLYQIADLRVLVDGVEYQCFDMSAYWTATATPTGSPLPDGTTISRPTLAASATPSATWTATATMMPSAFPPQATLPPYPTPTMYVPSPIVPTSSGNHIDWQNIPTPTAETWDIYRVVYLGGMNVRTCAGISSACRIVGGLDYGQVVELATGRENMSGANGCEWRRIAGGYHAGNWVAVSCGNQAYLLPE